MKRLPRFAFPPVKLNGQQVALYFGPPNEEMRFFVKCPDCMKMIELRCAADGDYGIIIEMLHHRRISAGPAL